MPETYQQVDAERNRLRGQLIEAEAQRDRAMELLREVAPYLERHAQILHDRINAFLAERQGGAS